MNYVTVITLKQVLEIRKKYATGKHSYRSLAREYCTGHTTIADIICYRTWKEYK